MTTLPAAIITGRADTRRGYREGDWGVLIALMAALYPMLSELRARLEVPGGLSETEPQPIGTPTVDEEAA
jgi:hypothetical protein